MSSNCHHVRSEIEESLSEERLSPAIQAHLSICEHCASFAADRQKLQQLVASLGSVAAPADFDFKLRARLAAIRSPHSHGFLMGAFGFRPLMLAALVLVLGLTLVLINLRSRSEQSPSAVASQPTLPRANSSARPVNGAEVAATSSPIEEASTGADDRRPAATLQPVHQTSRRNERPARSERVRSADLSVAAAPILRPLQSENGYAFPLDSSYQPLKVSVDDGRGKSRTISLPRVSFGSSRALARNPAPIMASTRDAW